VYVCIWIYIYIYIYIYIQEAYYLSSYHMVHKCTNVYNTFVHMYIIHLWQPTCHLVPIDFVALQSNLQEANCLSVQHTSIHVCTNWPCDKWWKIFIVYDPVYLCVCLCIFVYDACIKNSEYVCVCLRNMHTSASIYIYIHVQSSTHTVGSYEYIKNSDFDTFTDGWDWSLFHLAQVCNVCMYVCMYVCMSCAWACVGVRARVRMSTISHACSKQAMLHIEYSWMLYTKNTYECFILTILMNALY
jgi:hypothetical protein